MLDILLNRRGGVPVRDQLVTQLELKILSGALRHGQRLPSVRALARRLNVHHNTVSAAYRDLQVAGHVELRRGAGVFVCEGPERRFEQARDLDEMIRLALRVAYKKGFRGPDIRAAVERWLAAAPPDRVVVVDPVPQMAEVLAREVADGLHRPIEACAMDDVARDPARVAGAMGVVLPYHSAAVQRLAPGCAWRTLPLEVSAGDREALLELPAGAIVLVVSHSPTVLPFASVFLRSLRGDELLVETKLLAEAHEWRRLAKPADLVLADVLATPEVARARPRRMREVRMVAPSALDRLRDALAVVAPR